MNATAEATATVQTGARSLPDHFPLKLCKAADHLHHHTPRRRRRIDGLGK